jgi:hypothetical protein
MPENFHDYSTIGSRLREQNWKHGFLSENATCAVTAGWNDHELVAGAVILLDVIGKSTPAFEAIRALRHRGA